MRPSCRGLCLPGLRRSRCVCSERTSPKCWSTCPSVIRSSAMCARNSPAPMREDRAGAGAVAAHRSRPRGTCVARARTRFQVRRPPTVVSTEPDLLTSRLGAGSLHARRLGGRCPALLEPLVESIGRHVCRRQAARRRHARAGAVAGMARPSRPALDVCARRSSGGMRRTTGGYLSLLAGSQRQSTLAHIS